MPKWWNKPVTVFTPHFTETDKKTVWSKYVFKNCFWGCTKQSQFLSAEIYCKNRIRCRIPLKTAPDIIAGESVLFLGLIAEDIPDNDSANRLKKLYPENMTANTVVNNTEFPLSHCNVTGA